MTYNISPHVNAEKLKKLIKDKGYTYTELARILDNTYTNVYRKFASMTPFKWSDILIICDLLELNDWGEINNIFNCDIESNKKVS